MTMPHHSISDCNEHVLRYTICHYHYFFSQVSQVMLNIKLRSVAYFVFKEATAESSFLRLWLRPLVAKNNSQFSSELFFNVNGNVANSSLNSVI